MLNRKDNVYDLFEFVVKKQIFFRELYIIFTSTYFVHISKNFHSFKITVVSDKLWKFLPHMHRKL